MLPSYPVAFFKNARDNRPQQRHMRFERFCEILQNRKVREDKDGPLFSPVEYKPDTTRANANVQTIGCLVLDGDHAGTVESFCEKWNALGLAYFVYSTHSHTPEEPRWRVIFPLASEFTIENPDQWRRFYRAAAQHLGGSLVDDACKDPARIHYLPSCPPEMAAHAFHISQEGRALDPAEIHVPEPEARQVTPAPRKVRRAASRSDAERLLDTLVERAITEQSYKGRHKAGVDLACQFRDNLSEFGYTEGDALAAMQQYQSSVASLYDRAYTWKEAEETFHRIMQTAARTAWERREQASVWGETAPINKPEPEQKKPVESGPENPEFPDNENTGILHEMRSDSLEISRLLSLENEPEIQTEPEAIGASLYGVMTTMEKRIRRQGGIPEKFGLTVPPDIDAENLISIGKALKGGEDRLNTLLFFTWADWWRAVNVHADLLPAGQKKGRKGWILGRVYRGYNSEFIKRKRDDLTEKVKILTRIEKSVPKVQRDMTRSVHFYELLSRFPAEEQYYWLDQPRDHVTLRMSEQIAQQKAEREDDHALTESDGAKSSPTKVPPISDSIEEYYGANNTCSNKYSSVVNTETGETLPVDPSKFAVIQAMQEEEGEEFFREVQALRTDAARHGMKVCAYIHALRTGAPLPDPLPEVEFPPHEPEDAGLIGVAKMQMYTQRNTQQEKPVYRRAVVADSQTVPIGTVVNDLAPMGVTPANEAPVRPLAKPAQIIPENIPVHAVVRQISPPEKSAEKSSKPLESLPEPTPIPSSQPSQPPRCTYGIASGARCQKIALDDGYFCADHWKEVEMQRLATEAKSPTAVPALTMVNGRLSPGT